MIPFGCGLLLINTLPGTYFASVPQWWSQGRFSAAAHVVLRFMLMLSNKAEITALMVLWKLRLTLL